MSPPVFRLFVYGTLMRGGPYHARFCAAAEDAVEARTVGRLRLLPAGYPMLHVPAHCRLAEGSSDPLRDLEVQSRLDGTATAPEGFDPRRLIAGEIFAFRDAARVVPPIDAFEDFHSERPSLYRRALIPVRTHPEGRWVAAWAYVGDPLD